MGMMQTSPRTRRGNRRRKIEKLRERNPHILRWLYQDYELVSIPRFELHHLHPSVGSLPTPETSHVASHPQCFPRLEIHDLAQPKLHHKRARFPCTARLPVWRGIRSGHE